MTSPLNEGFLFIITTLFDMYLFVLVLRLVLVWAGANYFDPITQFVVKLTDFIIKPLRRFIPNLHRIEISTLVVILMLETLKFLLVSVLNTGMPAIPGLVLLAASDTLRLLLQFFIYAILLQVIMSWVQPHSPVMHTLYQITSPIMRPVQRLIPPIGGMDISPIPAMMGLQLMIIVLVNPLMSLAVGLAFAS